MLRRVFCFLDELTASFSCGVKTVSCFRGVGAERAFLAFLVCTFFEKSS